MLTEYEYVRMSGRVVFSDGESVKEQRCKSAASSVMTTMHTPDMTIAPWKPFLTLHGNRKRLLLAAMFLHAAGAKADQADTWNLFAGINQTHDANLFRLADSVDPMTVAGKPQRSEDITSTHFGVSFDKSVSMQRFRFDYTVSENRYETYSYLNFAASIYSGTWNWALTPRLQGTLSARHSEALAGFADYRNYSGRNVQKSGKQYFEAEGELHGPWRLVAAISRDDVVNSQAFLEASDSVLMSYEVGGKYLAKSGSWISVVAHRGEGEYQKLQYVPFSQLSAPLNPQYDKGYSTKEEEVRLYWTVTGKSSLDGRISHVSREHDNFSQRDYSGYAGQVDYNWNAGGKIRLNFSARQVLSPWQDFASSYYVGRTYSVNPVWQFSGKASARLQLSQEERDFKGPLISGLTQRQDKLRSGMLALDWAPLNALSVSASIQRDERESNVASLDFKDTLFRLSGRLFF